MEVSEQKDEPQAAEEGDTKKKRKKKESREKKQKDGKSTIEVAGLFAVCT